MTEPVTIQVNAAKSLGDLHPIYRFFGADEPNYATMKDGQKLIGELGQLGPHQVFFRTHNLLTTGDGTPALKWGSTNAYTEDDHGRPVYNWTIVDSIFDTYLARGVKPYVQIGFMPKALSRKPDPYQHSWHPGARYEEIYTGWAYPPDDFQKWGELVYQWAKHCAEKYGLKEVETWYWETWNEPNIGYWQGTPEEFNLLHDHAMAAVRHAIPNAKIGGADTAGGGTPFMRNFLEHCVRGKNEATGQVGSPLDFISFHAKGAPTFADGHVRMGIANQLRDIDRAFDIIASFPELKSKPIVIGESDPDGCAACQGPQLGYRNGTMYSSYTAASFARKHDLAARHGVNLEGALTWAFEFEPYDYFAGFRVLASNGLDLPVLNVFRMLGQMGETRIETKSSAAIALDDILKNGVRGAADVSALAGRSGDKVSVLLWHYHDDDVPAPDATVEVQLSGLGWSGAAKVTHYRVDANHSNAHTLWQKMGAPAQPTIGQLIELERGGKLALLETPTSVHVQKEAATLRFDLPRQAVSLLVIEKV